MERNQDKRLDPALLVKGAQSVVVCAAAYNRGGKVKGDIAGHIASYALSRDYHITIKERLYLLLEHIRSLHPSSRGRVFVDTAPVLEKSWACEAGLGWTGRNSLLVNPDLGSFLMLGVIITDALLPADAPYEGNGCGTCRACLSACPAGAILPDRTIDASRCISALTIEHATGPSAALHGRIFGCDTCQNVCPHNIGAPISDNKMFAMKPGFMMPRQKWLAMEEEEYRLNFGDTPLERLPLEALKQRIRAFIKE